MDREGVVHDRRNAENDHPDEQSGRVRHLHGVFHHDNGPGNKEDSGRSSRWRDGTLAPRLWEQGRRMIEAAAGHSHVVLGMLAGQQLLRRPVRTGLTAGVLVVAAAGRTYAVPLNSVLEILEVHARDVRTLSTREVISVRGATLPLVRLARFFALSGERAADVFFVVVVGLAQERLGIAVDDLVGQQDIVVKPLGAQLQGVRGVAGATDLGSRRTVLVLDVGAIIEDVASGDALRDAAGQG